MRKITLLTAFAAILGISSCCPKDSLADKFGEVVTISEEVMADKIKGAWFGQTIGCTYGGPTEFKYKGGIIHDGIPIIWYDDYIYDTFIADPGLYDDVYMDLTFVDIMLKHGLDAPVELYANAFANDDYKLWHANQAARYNILNGIPAPASGHWMNNPHADDIDFQIEADFIGMITPGMVNTSSEICDGIGHIMNYGDGWYGGVFVSAMYSLAYITDDIPQIIEEAAKVIPEGTKFRSCIDDVLKYWRMYPDDWKQCWFEVEKRHGVDIGCPEGVWNGFNIDAVINSAYVAIGLLYGESDFEKTMEISTRCGHDSDCNPATAAGILGTIYGYEWIPASWKTGIEKIEDMAFPYTDLSLNSICGYTLDLMKQIAARDGEVEQTEGQVSFRVQTPETVRYEQCFEGLKPVDKVVLKKEFNDELVLNFEGTGIVVLGKVLQIGHSNLDYKADVSAYIDGEKVEDFIMPLDYIKRKYDIFHKYGLEPGKHTLRIVLNNPNRDFVLNATDMVVYGNI